jgi:hypothetical protein
MVQTKNRQPISTDFEDVLASWQGRLAAGSALPLSLRDV